MTASELLDQVIRAYRGAATYSDSGLVSAQIQAPGGKVVEAGCQFSTSFVRGKLCNFRYQWNTNGQIAAFLSREEDDNISVVCSNAEGVFKRYPEEGLTDCESLPHAVADATGISFGGVYYIASLLMDNIVPDTHWFFRRLQKKVELKTAENFHGLTCDSSTEKVQVVIDSNDFHLKEMTLERPSSTITFQWLNCFFDGAIDNKVFDQYRF